MQFSLDLDADSACAVLDAPLPTPQKPKVITSRVVSAPPSAPSQTPHNYPTVTAAKLCRELLDTSGIRLEDTLLPINGDLLSEADTALVCARWNKANWDLSAAKDKAFQQAFAMPGWPFQWFSSVKPLNKHQSVTLEAISNALDAVEDYYPAIFERGIEHSEDMGLLMQTGFGKSEGVFIKRSSYSETTLLVQICCTTGPKNFEAGSRTVEFEPGCKSHFFYLLYKTTHEANFHKGLPTPATLQGDIAAYPLITAAWNTRNNPHPSEGWTGSRDTRPRFIVKSWTEFTRAEIVSLLDQPLP